MEINIENIKAETVQMGRVNRINRRRAQDTPDIQPAKEEAPPSKLMMIDYNAAYMLSGLVGRLVIERCSLDDFDKLAAVRENIGKVVQEHQLKLKEVFDEYGIKKFEETHPQAVEIGTKLTELVLSPSSVEVNTIQVYTREEISSMWKEAKIPFSFDEQSILMSALKINN